MYLERTVEGEKLKLHTHFNWVKRVKQTLECNANDGCITNTHAQAHAHAVNIRCGRDWGREKWKPYPFSSANFVETHFCTYALHLIQRRVLRNIIVIKRKLPTNNRTFSSLLILSRKLRERVCRNEREKENGINKSWTELDRIWNSSSFSESSDVWLYHACTNKRLLLVIDLSRLKRFLGAVNSARTLNSARFGRMCNCFWQSVNIIKPHNVDSDLA